VVWVVVGAVAAAVGMVAMAVVVDRRDRRAGRRHRDSGSMWTGDVREHRRDVRALRKVHMLPTDISWTRHSRRGRDGR
jgi:hypothetical protein